jgi:exopolysaccharide biosynthesis polyprenyl glycosylphosphotransferase
MKKTELVFNIQLVAIDFFTLVLSGIAAYFLRLSPWLKDWRPTQAFFAQFSFFQYLPIAVGISLVWMAIFGAAGIYQSKINRGSFEDFIRIVVASSAGVAAITALFFFKKELFDSRFILLAFWFFAIIFTTLDRLAVRAIWRKRKIGVRNVILLGDSAVLEQVKNGLEKNPYFCSRVVNEFRDFDIGLLNNCLKQTQIDEIIICDPNCPREKTMAVANYCEERQIDFRFIPDLYQAFFSNISVETISGFPVLELKRTPLEGWNRFAKRAMDISISLPGIVLLSPFWMAVAIAVKIDSPGPAIVKLKRISRGKQFYLYKFRSMRNNSQDMKIQLSRLNERNDGPLFKMKDDPRITRVGKLIRKTWIDELPQLVNVLKGEMSLVGPRPHEPEEVARYQNHHRRVFFVKSGMTGLAQISGSSKLKFEEEIKFDLYYIKNWSIYQDLKILAKTAVLFFKPKPDC